MTFRVGKMRKFKSIIYGIGSGITKRQNSMIFTDKTAIRILTAAETLSPMRNLWREI